MKRNLAQTLKMFALAIPFATAGVALATPPSADLAPSPPPTVLPVVVDGAAVFEASCTKCHGDDGKGKTKMGDKFREKGKDIPALGDSKDTREEFLTAVRDGVTDTPMKAYGKKLSPAEIEAVVTYVMAFRPK